MIFACWSPKGGSGTTTVAVALAALLAQADGGAVIADCAGDVPAVLGLPDPVGPGLVEWLAAGADVPADALARLEVDAGGGLRLLAAGPSSGGSPGAADHVAAEPGRLEALVGLLEADPRPVVADCGRAAEGIGLALAAGAGISLVVLRPCYLALRRALAAPVRPSGALLVVEEGRSLGEADVADVLGVPVVGCVPVDPAVARAVDAGLLARRPPRSVARALRGVVATGVPGGRLADGRVADGRVADGRVGDGGVPAGGTRGARRRWSS